MYDQSNFYYDIKIERIWIESTVSDQKDDRPSYLITLSAIGTKLILC